MSTSTKPGPVKGDRPPSKELREIARMFKQAYTLERSGSDHFRIRDGHGRFVEFEGRPIQIPGNPGTESLRKFRKQVEEAGIVKGTPARPPTPEALQAREKGLRRMHREQQAERQARASVLHDRFVRAFQPVGGLKVPGLATDLGEVGALILRENPEANGAGTIKTPDRISQNAYRVLQGAPVIDEYHRIWELLLERLERAPDPGGEWYTLVRSAKRLPDDTVHVRLPAGAEEDWPFRVKLVPLSALLVDDTYQRPVGWSFVRREAARFDPSLVGTIDVAQRSPSRFAILDGQQRTEIVRLVGKTTVWASVYSGLDLASEARFFLHKNGRNKIMHPYYQFRARLASDEADALAINEIVTRHGYELSVGAPTRDTNHSNIAAIKGVETAYRRKLPDGTSSLDPTLEILKQSTLGRQEGQSATLIRGVSFALMEQPDMDRQILIDTLVELGPQLVLGRARDSQISKPNDQKLAHILLMEYHRRAPKKAGSRKAAKVT